MRPIQAEAGPAEDRIWNSVFRPGKSDEGHRDQHDPVSEENRKNRLPPVHSLIDQPGSQLVGRNANGHSDPERGNVPDVPGAVGQRDGPEIIVEEWAAFEGLNRIRREFQETAIFPLRFHFWFLASCFLLFNS